MTETVASPEALLEAVNQHAAAAYPNECCGFLYGRRDGGRVGVGKIQPAKNERSTHQSRRYLISPEQYLEAEALAEAWGLELLGVYHSHPDHPPVPSSFDKKWALPGWIYLVVSVRKGRPQARGWWELSVDRSAFWELPFLKEAVT